MKRGRKRKHDFDATGIVCQNPGCKEYHRPNHGHVKFAYMGGTKRDTAYLRCDACGRHFSENKGTFFYRKKTDRDTITKALKSTVEGTGIRATARVFDLGKNTVLEWVKEAGAYSQDLEKKIVSEDRCKRNSAR